MKVVAVILLFDILAVLALIWLVGCASPALPSNFDASLRLKVDTNSPQPNPLPVPSGTLKS